ncbi:unnamed protein product [Ixodes pacificus]
MVMAAAEVKPLITGPDMNSTMKPTTRKQGKTKSIWMMPERKVRMTAYVGPPCFTYSAVMMDMMAVGPIVRSLQLPKMAYMKPPMNAVYRPYWKKTWYVQR